MRGFFIEGLYFNQCCVSLEVEVNKLVTARDGGIKGWRYSLAGSAEQMK